MKVVLLIPPKDFKDETVSMAKLLFEKWGITPVIASYSNKECTGSHGAVYMPELNATKLNAQDYDAIVLVDGEGVDSYKLYDFRPLTDLVKNFAVSNKIIAALGNAIKIVSRANVIADRSIAAPDDEETRRLIRIYRGEESNNEVEFDGNILTAKSADYTQEFLDTLLAKLGAK